MLMAWVFAIPINSVKGIVKTVLKTGEIDKAYLGVQYVDINADIAEAYKLPVKRGAYIRTSSGTCRTEKFTSR